MLKIKTIRKSKKISIRKISIETGISQDTIRKIEHNGGVNQSKVEAYAKFLGIELMPVGVGSGWTTNIVNGESGTPVKLLVSYREGHDVEIDMINRTITQTIDGSIREYDYERYCADINCFLMMLA